MAKKQGKFATGLKKANQFWSSAKKRVKDNEGKGFAEYSDGKYIARVVKADIGESQTSGRTQVVWAFRFEDGKYEGDEKLDFAGMDSEDNIYYLGRRLEDFGYEMPDTAEELQETLDAIVAEKPLCKIRLKTKGEFQNVYIDRVYDKDDEPETEDEEEDEAPAKKVKSGKKAKAEPEPEEDEAEEDEEESDEAAEEVEEESDDEAESEDADEESDEEAEEEEETEEEADEEEEVDLAVDMAVVVTYKGAEVKGKVIEILESEGKARIRKDDDNKVIRVAFDDIAVAPEAPEEPKKSKKAVKAEPPPPPPAKKKKLKK